MFNSQFLFFIFFVGLTFKSLLAQSPGGYSSNLRFWVKSSSGTFSNAGTNACTNNTALQQWNDQSGNSYNVSQTTSSLRPTFFSTGSNGNPIVRFTGTHFLDATSTLNIAGNTDYSGFFVVKLTSANAGGTADGNGDYVLDRTTGTNELFDLKVVASGGTNRFFFQKRNDSGGNLGGPTSTTVIDNSNFQIVFLNRTHNNSGNTISRIFINGLLEDSQTNVTETTTPPIMRIGRHATNSTGGMNGDLTEIAIYNNVPSTDNRQKVESYLAIKYGISLNQSTLRDYFNSGGSIVYPATTTHSNYVTNIAGIAQDNASGLTQSNSRNQNSTAYVRMQNPSAFNDGDYLMWGSNNASIITSNTVDIDGTTVKSRLSRVWRIAETNEVGTVDITIDLTDVPGAKTQADLRLLIDRDGDGFFDNDMTPLTGTLSANNFSVSGVNFQNGDYFTVGSVNKGSTPLPVELSEFTMNCFGNKVIANWTTMSEKNAFCFCLQKSNNAQDFYEIGKLPAIGNSSIKQTYQLIVDTLKLVDTKPVYYRLLQIDLDGKMFKYPLVTINCNIDVFEPIIFPNPSSGKFYIQPLGQLTEINLIDVFGKNVLTVLPKADFSCLDLSYYPKGFYFLRLLLNNQIILKKIYLN